MTRSSGTILVGEGRSVGASAGTRPRTRSSGMILVGEGRPEGRGAGTRPRTRVTAQRLIPGRRPDKAVGEWLAAVVRGLDALEFLERSREVAAETVVATPARFPVPRPPAG